MYAYRTPGVKFEWLDSRRPDLAPLRTDIAGFVGIATRGPLHRPVKVESWTQFTSIFGSHTEQSFLAYAVEGFFANGGQTCWVVRVADPVLARPAYLDLLDEAGEPALRLVASTPGVWGRKVSVSLPPAVIDQDDRFNLLVRTSNAEVEVWRNLGMEEFDETGRSNANYVKKVLETGSLLVAVDTSAALVSYSSNRPDPNAGGLKRIKLVDSAGNPTLELYAHNAPHEGWGSELTVSVVHTGVSHFSLQLRLPQRASEVWRGLSMDPNHHRYVETVINRRQRGSHLMRVKDLRAPSAYPRNRPQQGRLNLVAGPGRLRGGSDGLAPRLRLRDNTGQVTLELTAAGLYAQDQEINVSAAHSGTDRFSLTLDANGSPKLFQDLTMNSASLELLDASGEPTLRLAMPGPDDGASTLMVSVEQEPGNRFSLVLQMPGTGMDGDDDAREVWSDLTMDPDDPDYVEKVLNGPNNRSRWVVAYDIKSPSDFPDNTPDPTAPNLRDGVGHLLPDPRYVQTVLNDPQTGSRRVTARNLGSMDGSPPVTSGSGPCQPPDSPERLEGGLQASHLSGAHATPGKTWGLAALEAIDDVSIVAIPDIMVRPINLPLHRPAPRCHALEAEPAVLPLPRPELPGEFSTEQIGELQRALITHCEKLKDRVAILDSHAGLVRPDVLLDVVLDWREQFRSRYAAFYYPWLLVPDPLRQDGRLRSVPPSGHLAGVYARVDRQVGVHKPPANEILQIVRGVSVAVDDSRHGELNENAINVIRTYNGRGVRVAGARTLSPEIEWRYINVRRLLIMIEETIDERLQWTVFELNNRNLWRDVDRVVTSFLDQLWRRGMLDGATAEEAYQVRCDESTNPIQETALGRLICEIGVLPPWPAEFVVVRIGVTEGGTEVMEALA